MNRPRTTLFMLMSLDGKISTGGVDERDVADLGMIKPLVLKKCETLANSYIHLQYDVVN